MKDFHRIKQIEEIIKQKKFVSIKYLCEELYVSDSTIRRDLKYLEKQNVLQLTRGGAILPNSSLTDRPLMISKKVNLVEKRKIASIAFDYIQENDTIFIDSGSSCLALIDYIVNSNFNNLHIITNGLLPAHILSENTTYDIIITGGSVSSHRSSVTGEWSKKLIENYFANLAFVSSKGLDPNVGFTDLKVEEINIKKAFCKNSKNRIALMDSSKFNQVYFVKSITFDDVDIIVSDVPMPKSFEKALKENNVENIFPES